MDFNQCTRAIRLSKGLPICFSDAPGYLCTAVKHNAIIHLHAIQLQPPYQYWSLFLGDHYDTLLYIPWSKREQKGAESYKKQYTKGPGYNSEI